MRALLLAALVLLPQAAAQLPDVQLVELRAEDPPPVLPLQGAVVANMTVRVSCALVEGQGGVAIAYEVTAAPAWATVVVSPASDVADVRNCDGGYVTRDAILTLTASDMAPAFRPSPVEVRATAGPEGRKQTANATINLTAEYFSILDVQLAESSRIVAPGGEVAFAVSLANLGNAQTRVRVEVENATEDLTVHPVDAVLLESKQQGGMRNTGELSVRVTSDAGGLYVNRVGTATLRLFAEHAGEPPRQGDSTTISFIVTTKSGAGGEGGNDSPLGPVVALAALALVASFLRGGTKR